MSSALRSRLRTILTSRRTFRLLAVALLSTWVATTTKVSLGAHFSDADDDGIDDGYEQELAERFLPTINYSNSEPCDGPAWPAPILFRVRHPSVYGDIKQNYILINYVRMYNEDCVGRT